MHHIIGEITLSISTILYTIWFIPQLLLTFRHKKTENLSLFMHGFLLLGYSADLLYGFGRHMAWQYRFVTIIGLVFLVIQHYQFAKFGPKKLTFRIGFAVISLAVIAIVITAIFLLLHGKYSKNFYDTFGLVSNGCWFSFALPQIIKNFKNKTTEGLSFNFILISVFISALDIVSALTLNWDYPSLIGIPLILLKKSSLLAQFGIYRKK